MKMKTMLSLNTNVQQNFKSAPALVEATRGYDYFHIT